MTRISLLLGIALLVGCTANQPHVATLLEKKVECEKYASKMLSEYRETGSAIPGATAGANWYIERAFFSPKRESCLCVLGASIPSRDGTIYDIDLVDSLTRKLLWSRRFKDAEVMATMADEIEAEVKRYE